MLYLCVVSGTSYDVLQVSKFLLNAALLTPEAIIMAPLFGLFLCSLPLFISILSLSEAQIFAALTHMTDFIRLEQSFSSILDEYLQDSVPSASSELERFSNDVKQHLKDLKDEDMEIFLGHPVNSYLLVRRFLHDWRNVTNQLDETNPIGKGKFLWLDIFPTRC